MKRSVKQIGFMLVGGIWALFLVVLLWQYQQHPTNNMVMEDMTKGQRIKATNSRTSSLPSSPPSWPTCQRNTSMANTGNMTAFSSLPARIQDFIYYRHCRHFPLLLDVPDKCGGAERSKDVFLLLVIKSSPENYERREVLRKTWGEERLETGKQIRRMFLVGTAGSGFERQRLNRMLKLEQHGHRDIVQWDFHDSFFNLTLKQVLFLEWMDRNCPHVHFLLNGDDDIFANTDNMVEYLLGTMDSKEDSRKHLFAGHLIAGVGPIRTQASKYYIPVQVQESERYPPYYGGGGFLLSGYTAMIIYGMSKSITLLPIDDVYMGMCLEKAGLKPESHMGVRTAGLHVPSRSLDPFHPCFYRETLLVHRFMPAQIYVMWHEAHDPNVKCGLDFSF